jgi:creatinine amidohydrolase
MEQMTWEEIEKSIMEQCILIIPIGSIEQHGPHLPLATDLLNVLRLANLLTEKIKAVIAPPIYYTYTKPMQNFPGTVSINGTTLIKFIKEVSLEFIRQGFQNLLFLNGHFENFAFLKEGVSLAVESCGVEAAKCVIVNWWDLIPEKVLADIFLGEWAGWEGVHASFAETSLALALNSELVRTEKIVDDQPEERLAYSVLPIPSKSLPKSGIFSKTTTSSKEKGNKLKEVVIRELLNLIQKEFSNTPRK